MFPLGIIVYKYFKQLILKCCKKKYEKKINVDMEYAMLITKLESVISFACIFPLIIPVSLIAVESNKKFYNIMIDKDKLDWTLTSFKGTSSFPINFLLFGVLFGQSIIVMFFKECIRSPIYSITEHLWIILLSILVIMDVLFTVIYKKTKKKYKQRYNRVINKL